MSKTKKALLVIILLVLASLGYNLWLSSKFKKSFMVEAIIETHKEISAKGGYPIYYVYEVDGVKYDGLDFVNTALPCYTNGEYCKGEKITVEVSTENHKMSKIHSD